MKNTDKKPLFLLGGYDLEMIEIKNILIENNQDFFDNTLSWGAKLSSYQHVINDMQNKSRLIIAIELLNDIPTPTNFLNIDHHNNFNHLPSSIEQVANFLEIELSEYQKLVAINDVEHIKGLKKAGASKEKIEELRQKDRFFQGVTQEDELLAIKELTSKKYQNNCCIIKTSLDKFSPLTDRLEEENLIVYSDKEMIYYGKNRNKLVEKFGHYIKEHKAFYGGTNEGFFGFVKDVFDEVQINTFLEEILTIMSVNSYHIFILPFRWDKITKSEDISNKEDYFFNTSLDERIKIDTNFNQKILDCGWTYKPFKVDSDLAYNQYNYFYDFVKKSLYNQNENFVENQIIYSYEKDTLKDSKLEIVIKNKSFELDLEKVELKIFNTGIGLLCLNLKNSKYSNFDDILKINDFARRFYPQFVVEPKHDSNDWASLTKNSFLPEKITIFKIGENLEKNIIIEEKFKLTKEELNNPLKETSYLLKVLNGNKGLFSFNFKNENNILTKPLIDDRMFVISYCEKKDIELSSLYKNKDIDDIWYKYLFIDGKDKTCQSDNMTKKLLEDSTYDRWIKDSSLFGFTRYSFVHLLNKQDSYFFLNHTRNIYFNIVVLLLTQRASLLRFSEEISIISTIKEDSDDQLREKFSSIYRNYLKFINNICFEEITPQDQGIELYDLGVKQLRLSNQIKNLEKRIKDIHKFISMDMETTLFLSKYFE